MPNGLAGLERKSHVGDHGFRAPGRDHGDVLDLEAARRPRQRGDLPLRRGARERLRQAGDGLARADEGAPIGDGGFDRSERAPHHDRGGDHGAGGHFLADHEIGAQPEDHRLQQEPQHLRGAAETAGDVAQAGGGRDIAVVDPGPALPKRTAHSHRHDGLAAAALRLHHDRAPARVLRERLGRGAAGALGQQGHREEGDGADRRRHPEPGVDEETDGQEHRDPGQINDGDRARTGQKAADRIEVADRLGAVAGVPAGHGQADHRAVHRQGEALVEHRRGPHHHARADQVEHALEGIGADQEDRERNQRRHAPAAQDPVVDLEHVERPGEHQQVHHAREQRNAPERAPALAQGLRDVGMGRITARNVHVSSSPGCMEKMPVGWRTCPLRHADPIDPSLPTSFNSTQLQDRSPTREKSKEAEAR